MIDRNISLYEFATKYMNVPISDAHKRLYDFVEKINKRDGNLNRLLVHQPRRPRTDFSSALDRYLKHLKTKES